MSKVLEIALERIESLWDSWLKSRYQTQANIAHSIILNVKIVLDHGDKETVEDFLCYLDGFEEPLKQALCEDYPEMAMRIFNPAIIAKYPAKEKEELPEEVEIEIKKEPQKQLAFDFMECGS